MIITMPIGGDPGVLWCHDNPGFSLVMGYQPNQWFDNQDLNDV